MIQTNQTQTNKVFDLFPQYNVTKTTSTQNSIRVSSLEENPDEVVLSNNKENENKKSNKLAKIFFGSTLATTIIGVGAASLLLAKGHHGSGLTKRINKLQRTLKNPNISQETISYKLRKGANTTLEAMQASSNFAAVKDSWADKFYRKFGLGKFADGITATFKKVVDKTLTKKYNKVGTKVDDYVARILSISVDDLSKLDKSEIIEVKGVKKPLQEWIDIIETHANKLDTDFRKEFSTKGIQSRDRIRQAEFIDLPEKVSKRFSLSKDGLFNPENYRTYATEEIAKSGQIKLGENISAARKKITNNIESIMGEIDLSTKAIQDTIKPTDKTGALDSFKEIKSLLQKFKNCNGKNELADRAAIKTTLQEEIKKLEVLIQNGTEYSQKEQDDILKHLGYMSRIVDETANNSKGSLEEIKTILKALKDSGKISEKKYDSLIKKSDKITKELLNVTELEAGEYYLKQAELKVGSAPNDIVSLLFPAAVGGIAIAKGDDKDEKVSATLTTCVPLIGTMATFVYGTVKMFSGAKNLMFSAISGIALSKLGNYIDKLYKKYKETGSVTTVVKEEYDNFWTDVGPQAMNQLHATKVAE